MSDISNLAQSLNPNVYKHCSAFFENKDSSKFLLTREEESIKITANFPKADATTAYHMEITANGCEFVFSSNNNGLYVEIINDFEDFDDYFEIDKQHGSFIARLLREKYREAFAEKIAANDDLELDEDFNLFFIDNFVNYILDDVYIEE